MNSDGFGTLRSEIAGKQATEIFGAARDDDGFSFDAVVEHIHSFDIVDGKIAAVSVMCNPEKLRYPD
jgi:hypothetical protein